MIDTNMINTGFHVKLESNRSILQQLYFLKLLSLKSEIIKEYWEKKRKLLEDLEKINAP